MVFAAFLNAAIVTVTALVVSVNAIVTVNTVVVRVAAVVTIAVVVVSLDYSGHLFISVC